MEQRIQINGESYRVYIEEEAPDAQKALVGGHFLWVRQSQKCGIEVFVDGIPSRETQAYDATSLDGKRPSEKQRLDDIEKRLSAVERWQDAEDTSRMEASEY